MGNTFTWPIIRVVQRFLMILTLCCCVYVIFFLLSKHQDDALPGNSDIVITKGNNLIASSPTFDVKSDSEAGAVPARDIFSLAAVSPSGAVENTPKGQLPDHLKVVGILIGHPSQIIIEDSFSSKTYFIDEGNPQAGIKIVQVGPDQMTINYQGQDIVIPVSKN